MEITRREMKKLSLKDDRFEAVMETDFNGQDPDGNEIETTDEMSRKSSQVMHADMKAALNRLRIHMVCVCEQPEADQITDENVYNFDPEELENYEITGYSLSGSDDNAGVVITGKKLLKNGTVLNINTPFTKFEDEENYPHGGSLLNDITGCNFEVLAH